MCIRASPPQCSIASILAWVAVLFLNPNFYLYTDIDECAATPCDYTAVQTTKVAMNATVHWDTLEMASHVQVLYSYIIQLLHADAK